jgi:hypothetical protein
MVSIGSGTEIATVRECMDIVGIWSGAGAVREL